jgi:hypothetical protein
MRGLFVIWNDVLGGGGVFARDVMLQELPGSPLGRARELNAGPWKSLANEREAGRRLRPRSFFT